jgi:peptidylprolyl isomerase
MEEKNKVLLKEGDFLLIDYEIRLKDTNELLDTNIEDVAKKEKYAKEEMRFEPLLVILGKGYFQKYVEEEMIRNGVILGIKNTIEVPPQFAFGIREPQKIKVINAKELSKEGILPRAGQRIKIRDQEATIITVSGGRVVVDFNHPLAGKTIVYHIIPKRKIESLEEKILHLVIRRVKTIEKEKVNINIEENSLTIKFKEDVLDYSELAPALKILITEIEETTPNITNLKFIIEKEKPKEIQERKLTG